MSNPVVLGAIMPHPPILVPEIGRNRLKEAAKSVRGLDELKRRFISREFDAVAVITPHGEVGQASVPVYTGHIFEGNFSQFGVNKPVYNFKGDPELGLALIKDCELASSCPVTLLDHGALVPLYFVQAAGIRKPVLPLAIGFLSLRQLFEFGRRLARTAEKLGRRLLVIASADLSHRLTNDAPAGYSPRGKEFDERLVRLVEAYDVNGILDFDPALADEAGQDALWSIAVLLGALDGQRIKQELLSYEGPFGVGYMVAAFDPE